MSFYKWNALKIAKRRNLTADLIRRIKENDEEAIFMALDIFEEEIKKYDRQKLYDGFGNLVIVHNAEYASILQDMLISGLQRLSMDILREDSEKCEKPQKAEKKEKAL